MKILTFMITKDKKYIVNRNYCC